MKKLNSLCLKGMLLLATYAYPRFAAAQENTVRPFVGEQAVAEQLFGMNEHDINYHFTADLGGGNMVIVEFKRLTDWPDKGNLQDMLQLAATYYTRVQDSFRGATTPKRLDIHVPLERDAATLRIQEYTAPNNVVLLRGNMQAPLKLGMDTIRILYAAGEKELKRSRSVIQVQYTFLLKDIDQVKTVSSHTALIADVAHKFDSLVGEKKDDWSRPDKWTHNMKATYYPTMTNARKKLQVVTVKTDDDKGKFYRAFDVDFGLGATLFRNQLCPLTEVGLSYKWPTRQNEYVYVRLSSSNFADIVWNGARYTAYGITFTNLEWGWMKSKRNTNIPMYRTAIGFGWCDNPKGSPVFDPTLDEGFGRMYASFSISKILTISYDQYLMPSDGHSFSGISVITRLW